MQIDYTNKWRSPLWGKLSPIAGTRRYAIFREFVLCAGMIVVCRVIFSERDEIGLFFRATAAILMLLSAVPLTMDIVKDYKGGIVNVVSLLFAVGLIAFAATVYFFVA